MASAVRLPVPIVVPWKPLAALLLLLALSACATSPRYIGSEVGPPMHGDNRPHPGVAKARGLPIQGLDVARYQGAIDYAKVRAAGVQFVYMKATEGNDYVDPAFAGNWARAKAAGIAHGAYHFMTWCSTAAQQAAWFVKNVPADPDAMPPVLDLEWNHGSSCTTRFSKADMLDKIRLMLKVMEQHTGKMPVIYTDITFHHDILEGEHFDNAFWLRSTAAEPPERYGDRRWMMWQWTQTGTLNGVVGEVDRNAFYGDVNDWTMFLLTGCDPRVLDALGPKGKCQLVK
ncbi:MAG: glycoside hydrolase family 25 protein [Devosia sp.]|jgi:lysozyme